MTRYALVTGATGGLGRRFTHLLAADGWPIVLTARSREALDELAVELRTDHDVPVHIHAADLGAPGAVDGLCEELSANGLDIEILVNNAGFGLIGPFCEEDPPALEELVGVNVVALTQLTRRLVPAMIAAGSGRVLNVASAAAFLPGPSMAAYHASKAYVLSLSHALAVELRGTGVTVSCLCPGPSPTGFNQRAGVRESWFQRAGNVSPERVARTGYRGMLGGRPLITPGYVPRMISLAVRLVPTWFAARCARLVLTSSAGR